MFAHVLNRTLDPYLGLTNLETYTIYKRYMQRPFT